VTPAYVAKIVRLDSVSQWIRDAIAEKDFVPLEEPYRVGRSNEDVD